MIDKVQINIPDGFEIDLEKSDLSKGIVQFKPIKKKTITYEDVATSLFFDKGVFYANAKGTVQYRPKMLKSDILDETNATSREQIECLLAFNKLLNVAEYLHEGKKLEWNGSAKYSIYYTHSKKKLDVGGWDTHQHCNVFFSSIELARQAIEILGEEEIKKALFIYEKN